MALLWFDGFESYTNSADFLAIRNSGISSVEQNGMIISSTSRTGDKSCYFGNYASWIKFNLSSNKVSGVFGTAYRRGSGTPVYVEGRILFGVWDGATEQIQFHLSATSPTEIEARKGDGTLLGTTSGAGIEPDTWRYIEIKFLIDNSTGYIIIRSNESVVLNLTGIDTQMTANAYYNTLQFGSPNNLASLHDDIYICDLTGSKNNDFLGDVRVDVIRPDGAGTYSQFTPSAGSNYENVDESPGPDDDTTYNLGSTPGNKDSYALSSLSALGTTIHGVKSQITIRKSDVGSKNAKLLTISGGTEDLSDSISASDSFTTHVKIFEDNPDDSAAWEEADINSAEVGVQIVTTTTSTTSTTTTTA